MNAPIPTQVMEESHAELLTDILEDVVQSGTGKRAAIAGREIAGKTGTTDNYGDAWFVGYTPDLVVAVWVGYPDALTPMLTEFNGEPVAGGTLPAMIWKAFVEKTEEDEDLSFDSPPYLGGVSTWVVQREGEVAARQRLLPQRPARRLLLGARPRHGGGLQAQRGVRAARRRDDRGRSRGELAAQPLERERSCTDPRSPGRFPGSWSNQEPRRGGSLGERRASRSSSTKAQHGLLPNFVGSSLADVQREAKRLKLRLVAKTAPGREGTVLRQVPEPGVAVAPGLRVRLVVGDGSRS